MRFVPRGALLGASLMLLVTGCAGTARREGMGQAGGNMTGRLMRPADPIARLNPAKVTVGSMYDQGSYTAANVPPEAARVAAGGSGPLSVGGGQLADRGPEGGDSRSLGRSGSLGEHSRSSALAARESRSSTDWPAPEVTDDGWPLIAVAEETRPATRGQARPDDGAMTVRPIAGRDDSLERELSETADSRVESERLCFSEPGPRGEAPRLLVAGIDLETYAAAPVSSDPDTRQASNRRPVAALRDARSAFRPETDLAQPEPEPESAVEESFDEQLDSAAPALPDLSEFLPTFPDEPQPELDPLENPGLEPVEEQEPARDDVRPASASPDMLAEERPLPRQLDSQRAVETPSPFERSTIRDRLGSRFRKLQDRLTPPRFRADSPSAAEDEATTGQERNFRLPRLRSAEDARWLMPGNSPGAL